MTVQTTTDRMSNRPVVTIKLASTSDELLQCYALRAAVFMGEQQCPYWEEFDGNDYSASHLMLYVDGEPAASMRVRWFQGFAKLERAIILKRYRSLGLFIPFVEWAREFAAKKGYPKAYLHGQQRLWEIFERQGFRKVDDAAVPLLRSRVRRVRRRPRCRRRTRRRCYTDPMVLNRPEDQLDRPGILEKSMERGASNPHAEWTERRRH